MPRVQRGIIWSCWTAAIMHPRTCRSCIRWLRNSRRVLPLHGSRWLSAEAVAAEPIPPPAMEGEPKVYPDKIRQIVADISTLTLLETSQLNELLKVTLNIPDAPVMAAAVAAPAAQQSEEEEAKQVQTEFTVKLVKVASDDSKIKLIKEIKAQMEGMNLVQAKKFVDGLPQEVKTNMKKEDAEKLAAALTAAGGVVELE